jgi:nucleoside-diphosphate-sugar epimerase
MHTILGSGGAIGTELARALPGFKQNVRLVSRTPRKVSETDELFPASLLDAAQVDRAVQGSAVCYLTAGLEYKTSVWQSQWPVLMKNVIDACGRHGAKLVFFDNVYAIGRDNVRHITETSPISPTSKKGEVRAALNRMILEAVEKGNVQAIIARSPDFFSDHKATSMMMITVYDNMVKGKKAQWFGSAEVIHSMGYAPDLAMGTAILGNTPEAFNKIWNLPVDKETLTGRQWVEVFAGMLKKKPGVQVYPAWSVRALGLFVPILKEMHEMLYQFDRDYFFDSGKFMKTFGYTPKTNREAVRETLKRLGHDV